MAMTEKRRSERKLVALRAVVVHEMAKPLSLPASVQTLNLSKKGALIESPEQLFAGEVCTFSLLTNDGKSSDIQGRVVWAEKVGANAYRAGVAFRNLSPDEEYLLDLQLVRSAQ